MAYAKRIFNRYGMAGIYRGAGATICRDAPACGIYFCGNSYFLKQLNYRNGLKGYFDGDGCWRRKQLVTTLGCW